VSRRSKHGALGSGFSANWTSSSSFMGDSLTYGK
jgi:hypothetical protein